MKIFFLKISFLLLISALCSCSVRSFSYTKEKILTNFANFETFLNSEKISLDTIYLDKNNIKSIKTNKQEKTVHIIQKKINVEYFSPQNAFQSEKFQGIIINGELAENLKINRIEVGAIKSISILREGGEIYNPIRGNFLIITLK